MVIAAITPNTTNQTPDTVSAVVSSSSSPQVSKANTTTAQQQLSTVVSISQQARALNNAANAQQENQVQAANNPVAEQRETRPAEAAEKPGIQLLEGEKNNTPNQGNRVNTYV